MKRPYRKTRRAEAQEETRRKIVDATIALHQAKGIAATSMSDIAERAGVGKVTVYRHFPDEAALVAACSGHYFEQHPPPDIEAWRQDADPLKRLRRGLRETYRFHRKTEPMMAQVLAEARDMPVVEPYFALWRRAVDILAEPWPAKGADRKQLHAALALAVSFETWRVLVRERGLSDAQAADLMVRIVDRG